MSMMAKSVLTGHRLSVNVAAGSVLIVLAKVSVTTVGAVVRLATVMTNTGAVFAAGMAEAAAASLVAQGHGSGAAARGGRRIMLFGGGPRQLDPDDEGPGIGPM